MNNFYYLAHGGPGSGRYPWGSGDRPYQRLEGSRRKTSGLSGYIQSVKEKKAEKQARKVAAETQKREAEENERQRRMAADKERVLRSGSASEVMKYQGQLTNQELNMVAERLRLERQVYGYSEQDITTGLDMLKKIQSYTNVGSALAKDGIELWNSLASIYNATAAGKESPLTLVSKSDGGGGKKK